ncbi:hypothetical protein [Spirochaeta africana]|uniref:Uncharacterized protein n=1 Tax=Spirochaeta africana (strain ATCC 700263 / DSM 8902 / Z-7692) TaxID=889378 RepID=H9UI12_SPIAZ|nr:hypothetical protein [Spirochaeta africana]AFG37155.1 hypothetical protein Spiaf_1068 [Spirochaeta africana DSM 8902]
MKRLLILITSGLLLSTAAYGLGGGGIFWGESTIVPEAVFDGELANTNAQFSYSGGYGYGVNQYGQRSGGFGMIIRSTEHSPEELFGVFGGGITGGQIRMGMLTASMNLYMGIGGFGGSMLPENGGLSVLGELTGEVGVRVLGWMQISMYGGMQGISRVGMPHRMADNVVYAPVIGTRLTWGSF